MGKIKKILENELVGGTQTTDVYPVTSTKAVYDENNERLDNILGGLGDKIDILKNAGYLYAGVATLTTDPGTPKAKVFYIANGKGTYTNFGGIEVTEDEVVVLYWDSSWHKVSTGIASQAKLTELESKVDDALYHETAIDSTGTRTGYLNSTESYIADADYEILAFPVPQGGKIHVIGKIDKSCRAIFSNQPAAISADAFLGNIWFNSVNEETDIDVEVEVPEYTGQVYARVSKKKTLPMSVTLIDSINRIDKLEQKVEGIEDNVTSIEQSIDVVSEKTEQLSDLILQLNFKKLDDSLATKQNGRYLKSPSFYVADSNYSIYYMPIEEGDVIHLKGSNDVINVINFQGQVGVGAQVISTIATFPDESLHNIDIYATAPVGARYIVYSVKNNLALNCYKASRIDVDALNSIIYGEKRSIIYPVSASTRMNEEFADTRIKAGTKILFSMTTENQDAIGKSFKIYVSNNDSYTLVKFVKMPCSDVELLIPTLTSNSLLIQSVSALSTSASSVEVTLVFKQGIDERLKNLEPETSYIYVAPNGSDETGDGTIENPYATIFHANEMIADNSEKHRYIIKVADGTYTDLQVRYAGVSSSTYQGVVAKNFVTYEGNVLHPENVILKWDGSTGYSEPYDYDTMFFTKCLFHIVSEVETTIKGFTFDAKNTRYAMHIETAGGGMGSKWEVSDCIFNWHGVPSRTNTPAVGTGSGFFEKGHLLRCKINNDIANIDGWRNHDSNYPSSYDANRFKEGAEIVLESCDFGNSSILWRTLSTSNSYNGYNRCVIKNCIGIKTLSHSEASGVSNSWRARVECSDIETNNFSENEMY